jgi:cell division protein FtsB
MRFRFTIRDLLWLTILVVMAGAWWWDHRHAARQLNFCIEALHQVERELDDQNANADQQINSLRHDLAGEEATAAKARSDAAINAERPLRTPGPFKNWP